MPELQQLLNNLKSWNLHTRTNAARKLKDFRDPRITPALCKALFDFPLGRTIKFWQLQWAHIRNYTYPSMLRGLRWKTNALSYRRAILESLIAQNDPRAVKSLKKRLREGGYFDRNRNKTLAALAHFEGEEVWQILCALLVGKLGKHLFLEEEAAEYLFQRDKKRAIKPLVAAFAMSHLDNPRIGDWGSTAGIRGHIQERLIDVLVQIGDPAFDDLITALERPNFLLRDGVAKTLKELGDKRAVEALWRVNDNTPYAIVTLAHLDYAKAVDTLILRLDPDNPQNSFEYIEEIIDVLGENREEKAVPLLCSHLRNWHTTFFYPTFFGNIETALKKIGTPQALATVEDFHAYISNPKNREEELAKFSPEDAQAFFRPKRKWYMRLFPFYRNN